MTRAEIIAKAANARKLPEGISATQIHMWLPDDLVPVCRKLKPPQRGALWEIGYSLQQDGYLLLYRIIDALGGKIINTNIGRDTIKVTTASREYIGTSQFDLLIEIIGDLTETKPDQHNRENT
jgi:hypothetical protein